MESLLERSQASEQQQPTPSQASLGPVPTLPDFRTRDELLAQALGHEQSADAGTLAAASDQTAQIAPEMTSIEAAKQDFRTALKDLREGRMAGKVGEAQRPELESSLASLIEHLERLEDLSRLNKPPTPALSRTSSQQPPSQATAPLDALDSLTLTASTLRQSAREVVLAEQELLWSRIDDLLVHVSWLCQANGPAPRQRRVSGMSSSEYSISDLPIYTSPQPDTHEAPPGYSTDEKLTNPSQSSHSPRDQRLSDEKAEAELHNISSAIERLYSVSPQLANQRVAAPVIGSTSSGKSKKELREAQLVRLGMAIERLSKGRLDDQRAMLTPSASGKAKMTPEQELDIIMQAMDKASSGSTMANQRVALSDRQISLLNRARKTAQEAAQAYGIDASFDHLDKAEAARREHILGHTGIGRIHTQDAPSPLVSPKLGKSDMLDDDSVAALRSPSPATTQPQASSSRSSYGSLRKRFSLFRINGGSNDSPGPLSASLLIDEVC